MDEKVALKQDIITRFGTPCAVIDLDVVEANITRAQRLCDEAGVANRPHIKTHKSPILAQMQIEAGARGITCQKLGEAEVMLDAGITDILIATNLLGAARSGRLSSLQRRHPLKCCADSAFTLSAYADAARSADRPLDVLIECDTGQKRAGVETSDAALALVTHIRDDPWLNFAGLLFYPPLSEVSVFDPASRIPLSAPPRLTTLVNISRAQSCCVAIPAAIIIRSLKIQVPARCSVAPLS